MNKLISRYIKRDAIILYALPLALPIIILGAAFALNGVYPFGNAQILTSDLAYQDYPFLSDFWHKLREGNSLLWSWTAGGHDYIAHMAYFLMSPFNLLAALFPHALLCEALTAFLLIKIGLAGLFMGICLHHVGKKCDMLLPAFACMYALCAFSLGYYWNIIWFDTFALLPLVILGVYKLLGEGKFRLYVASLALATLLNFYMGLFVCVFVAIIFFALCAAQKPKLREFLRKLSSIAGYSAIAIGMTAFITLPAFAALQKSYRMADPHFTAFPRSVQLLNSFFDVLGNFIAFTPPTVMNGLPNLYSGMACVMLLAAFAVSKTIPRGERIAYTSVAAFLVVSTNVNVLEYIWHGFSYPTALPARYSFLVSFMLAAMAYKAYLQLDGSSQKRIFLCMGASAALVLLAAALGRQEATYIAYSALICIVYLALFAAMSINASTPVKGKRAPQLARAKEKRGRMLALAVFAVIVIELSFTSYIGVKTAMAEAEPRDDFPPLYDSYRQLLGMRQPPDNDFYRTEFSRPWSYNDDSLYGYNGFSLFSSLIDAGTVRLMESLGITASGVTNRYFYADTTPLANAFLNMRYLLNYDGGPADGGAFWEQAAEVDGLLLLENKRRLPLGFMVGAQTADFDGAAAKNPFDAQNDLFRRATGLDGDLFAFVDVADYESQGRQTSSSEPGKYAFTRLVGSPATGSAAAGSTVAGNPAAGSPAVGSTVAGNPAAGSPAVGSTVASSQATGSPVASSQATGNPAVGSPAYGMLKFDFKMPVDGCLYVFASVDGADAIQVQVLGSSPALPEIDNRCPYVFCAGSFRQGDMVSVAAMTETDSGSALIYAGCIDIELFDRGYDILAGGALELTEFSDTSFSGQVTAKEDGLLYTSVPHTGLWRAYVDGSEAQIITIGGAMAAVDLDAGHHTIEFRYHNNYLAAGVAISVIAALAFIAMIIKTLRARHRIAP